MALSLTYNGTTTSTIPGSPSNGDRIAMANGTLRVSFVWGTTHQGTQWALDLVEFSSNSGTSWTSVLYAKDSNRLAIAGTEHSATNGALSIITNTVSVLTLQLQASLVSTNTYTFTTQWTMTTSQPNCEVAQYLASSATTALAANKFLEDYGPAWLVAAAGNAVALYNGVGSPVGGGTRTFPDLWSGNLSIGRQFANPATTNRGYGYGMSMLLSGGILCSWVCKPSAQQNLALNILDASNSANLGGLDFQYAKGLVTFLNGVDSAYTSLLDRTPCFVRPGARWGSSSTSTFPQAATNTDATTTLNFVWSLVVEQVSTPGTTGLPYARYLLPQRINYWIDTLYARPNIGGSGISGGGSGPMWQTLATLESTVFPNLLSTYTTIVDSTYGYQQAAGGGGVVFHNYTNALVLQACLRWLNLGVGNGDAQAMADKMAAIIATYQAQSGNQTGAFYKIRNTTTNTFLCQEGNHAANGDQPHISMYTMAECLLALIEYYKVRGNQTLTASYGSIAVAALLDAACAWLVTVQQADGGWLVEYNTSNTYTSTSANGGATMPGSATVDLAASLYSWAVSSPTASAANKANWQAQALRAANYYTTSESVAHGNFEFGEGYTTYSHHGIKQLIRGFGRWYRLTSSPVYQEWMAYYFEQAILLCKRMDEVLNSASTNSKDVHTGGLISTIDWNGAVAGEASSSWAYILSEMIALHPGLLAYHYFYMWANLCHATWAYRDSATYTSSYQASYAYISPGTTFSSANSIDNSRFSYNIPSAALHLLPTHTLVACDNANVLSACLEANFAVDKPTGRTIMLYNPQGTSQVANLTVRGQAGKRATQDGTSITSTISTGDMLIALSLNSGQISKVVVH
jgi:hypothetical protein